MTISRVNSKYVCFDVYRGYMYLSNHEHMRRLCVGRLYVSEFVSASRRLFCDTGATSCIWNFSKDIIFIPTKPESVHKSRQGIEVSNCVECQRYGSADGAARHTLASLGPCCLLRHRVPSPDVVLASCVPPSFLSPKPLSCQGP
jgi:hypothetical protein